MLERSLKPTTRFSLTWLGLHESLPRPAPNARPRGVLMNERNAGVAVDAASITRQVNRLANERGALFDKAGVSFGLSNVEQQRLSNIERELDECFGARRRLRAERDARRFDRELPRVFLRSKPSRSM